MVPFNQKYHPLFLECGCWVICNNAANILWDAADQQVTEEQVRAHVKEHRHDL